MKKEFVILLLALCVVCNAQITEWNEYTERYEEYFNEADLAFSFQDSIWVEIESDSLFIEYEDQLSTYKQQIECDCYPCAAYCYRIVKREPDYYDFKRWYKNRKIKPSQTK